VSSKASQQPLLVPNPVPIRKGSTELSAWLIRGLGGVGAFPKI
jgi:hypothetical protein